MYTMASFPTACTREGLRYGMDTRARSPTVGCALFALLAASYVAHGIDLQGTVGPPREGLGKPQRGFSAALEAEHARSGEPSGIYREGRVDARGETKPLLERHEVPLQGRRTFVTSLETTPHRETWCVSLVLLSLYDLYIGQIIITSQADRMVHLYLCWRFEIPGQVLCIGVQFNQLTEETGEPPKCSIITSNLQYGEFKLQAGTSRRLYIFYDTRPVIPAILFAGPGSKSDTSSPRVPGRTH